MDLESRKIEPNFKKKLITNRGNFFTIDIKKGGLFETKATIFAICNS